MGTRQRMVFCKLAVWALVLLPAAGRAQAARDRLFGRRAELLPCSPAPCVVPPTQVSSGGFSTDTSIAASPAKSNQIVLGSLTDNCGQNSSVGALVSTDGGSDWSLDCMVEMLFNGHDFVPNDPPMVGQDRLGDVYVAAPYIVVDDSSFKFVALQKSTDGGANWSQPVQAMGRRDTFPADPWLAVDGGSSSPYVNSIYVSGVLIGPLSNNSKNEVIVSHSRDAGTTWQEVAVAPFQSYPDNDLYTNMTVGKDGTVYLTWMYCDTGPYRCNNNKGHMLFSKSTDGGNTWSTPTTMTTVNLLPTPLPNTNVGVTNIPTIGVDNSNGPNAGTLYVVMYAWTGTYMRVQVIRSMDGGNTWSRPVPVAPPSDTHDQFFPWLSVSSTGLVGVSWLDRRNDPANINYQAFAAISSDGGKSFQPDVQLTDVFSNPNDSGSNDGYIGDYTGNTWAGSTFVAAWMDSNNGTVQEVVGGIRLK